MSSLNTNLWDHIVYPIEPCPGVTLSSVKGLPLTPWGSLLSSTGGFTRNNHSFFEGGSLGCNRFWEPHFSMCSGSALLLIRVK